MSDVYVFLGPTLAEKDARAELDAVYVPRRPPGTSTGYGGVARVPSASSTATSTACRPYGTRKSCG
jgi:hypothetical protein